MRKPTDKCLLCLSAKSIRTNSHIFPRFLSSDFMKQIGKGNRGYEIDGHSGQIVQDSPKENYILCDSCEKYFSVLESYASDTFKNWKRKLQQGKFLRSNICEDLDLVNCESSNSTAVRLLVYSMFWRASISSHDLFNDYSLRTELEQSLRQILLQCKNATQLDADMACKPTKSYPIVMSTCDQILAKTPAGLIALSGESPCSLIVDRFAFLLFEDRDDVPDQIKEFTNNDANDCRFLVLSYPLWYSLTVRSPIDLIIQQTKIRSSDK